MSTFWERRKAEQQAQHQPYNGPVNPSDQPWWARGTILIPQQGSQEQEPQDASQSVAGQPMYQPATGYGQQPVNAPQPGEEGYVAYRLRETASEKHNFAQATNLVKADWCPGCGSGNYMKPTSSSAPRCFNCGYVDNRDIHEFGAPLSAVSDAGASRHARQISTGGFRGDIKSGLEAAQMNAQLEASAVGRSSV